jgi:hypothetical protein
MRVAHDRGQQNPLAARTLANFSGSAHPTARPLQIPQTLAGCNGFLTYSDDDVEFFHLSRDSSLAPFILVLWILAYTFSLSRDLRVGTSSKEASSSIYQAALGLARLALQVGPVYMLRARAHWEPKMERALVQPLDRPKSSNLGDPNRLLIRYSWG